MHPKMAVLAIPAALTVAGLVYHSIKTRGARDTAYFFLFALLFGIARGNTIWWITTVHFEGEFPYLFRNRLIGVYHDSFVADMGWILCLYSGTYIAVSVLERIPLLKNRLFAIISLASLFNATLSYAVESTAIDMGWWGWTLSTQSDILRDVPTAGIVAWYSVGFDFLVPYLLIRHYRKPGQFWPWLSLLIFPLHMLMHLSNDRVADLLPIVPYNIWHWGMILSMLFLPFLSRMELSRPWIPSGFVPRGAPAEGDPVVSRSVRILPFLGLGLVLSVLFVSDLIIVGVPGLTTTKAALIYFILLAIPAIPAWTVLALGIVMAVLGGKLFWVPLLVPGFYYALRGYGLWPRYPFLKLVYLLVPIILTWSYYDWSRDKHEVDLRYLTMNAQGVQLQESGDFAGAARVFDQATDVKPYSIRAWQNLSLTYVQMKRYDEAIEAMNRVAELRPVSVPIQENLGSIYMMKGDLDNAEVAFRRALEIDAGADYSRDRLRDIEGLRQKANADD